MTKIMVTGTAGFIGFHLARRLLEESIDVVGVDNLNSYYDVQLKKDRLEQLQDFSGFTFVQQDISERGAMADLFREHQCAKVVHLAAQAGVRYSLENPYAYTESNLTGFINILEGCRQNKVENFNESTLSKYIDEDKEYKKKFGDSDDLLEIDMKLKKFFI